MKLKKFDKPQPYQPIIDAMQHQVEGIIDGSKQEELWLLEHKPVYTAGTSADMADLIDAKFEVHKTGRGGKLTYHGPNQRIAYVMMDLKKHMNPADLKTYVKMLENWVINFLARLGIKGFIREGRVGVWVNDPKLSEAKIAAIGIRVKKWVAFHGICINYDPNLTDFDGIVPCGISEFGVTSLANFANQMSAAELDQILIEEFEKLFNIKLK